MAKLLTVSDSKATHAKVFKFLLDKHADRIAEFLENLERFLLPAEFVQIASICDNAYEKLYDCYFKSRVL